MIAVRCKIVVPVTRVPVENGAVLISGNRIVDVGSWDDLRRHPCQAVYDFPDAMLFPGLINAHCHLDYTDIVGKIPPTKLFTDWIKTILSVKATWSYTEYAQSWLGGAEMLLRSGCTTVADIEAVPELLPEVWLSSPLRVFSFLEMTGVKNGGHPAEIVHSAISKVKSLPAGRNRCYLSPHAPYSTVPSLYELTEKVSRENDWLVSTHLAESEEEFEMFMYKRGPLYEWLKKQRDHEDCGHGSPVRNLQRLGVLNSRMIAAHVNYLWRGDAEILGSNQVSVVHCPRSHSYFRHRSFPHEELKQQGVNICMATDSLASVAKFRNQPVDLNLFSEMQMFAAAHPGVLPAEILRMVTTNPARALGRSGDLGELRAGALADLMVLPFSGKIADVLETFINSKPPVLACMMEGKWIYGETAA